MTRIGKLARRLSRALARRTRVRPTVRGWQVFIVGAASLAVALSLGTTQLYQLAYAMLGLLVVALLLGLVGSRSLDLQRRMPRSAGITAGGSATLGLRLTNRSRLPLSGVEVVDRLPYRSVSRPPAVPAGEETTVESAVSFPRRGLYRIGPAEVASTDPLGLLRFRRTLGLESEILVYPEVHRISGFASHGSEESGGRIQPVSRGEEISGVREYRTGDDRRFIHWKSVARTGELFVKEFDPDVPRRHSVVLDPGSSGQPAGMAGQELEDAVSAAASAISHLDSLGLTYRLQLANLAESSTGFSVGSGVDSGPYHEAMRLLATAEADGRRGAAEALRQDASDGNLGEGVILVQREAREAARPALIETVREVSARGVTVSVILVASHTYTAQGGGRDFAGENIWEQRLAELVWSLESSGAGVRVLRQKTGVAGLSTAREAV